MLKAETPDPDLNTPPEIAIPTSARWDDLKVAIVLGQAGSFRRSADSLSCTINTVRARLDRLEGAIGQRLFRRSAKGVEPTPAGRAVIAAATRMQTTAWTKDRGSDDGLIAADEIRIGSSEALALLWMSPRIAELQGQIEGRSVNLLLSYDLSRPRGLEVDMEIGFQRARDPNMISARIATVHFMLFASRTYLATHGTPASLDDLKNHYFIEQAAPGVNSQILDFLVGSGGGRPAIALRTNSGMALLDAVRRGTGIAGMPTYVAALGHDLVPLALPVQFRFDIFLTYRADYRSSAAIAATSAWVKQVFTAANQPWFAEHFIHPNEFSPLPDADASSFLPALDNAIR